MARIRTVKPELRTDLTVASWPIAARYGFVLLWGYLDDQGRGYDDARLLAADLYPLDDTQTAKKVETYVSLWTQSGVVCRYEVDGVRYLHAVNWGKHQKINRPSPPRLPSCPIHGAITASVVNTHGGLSEDSLPELGTGNWEQGTGFEELGETSSAANPLRALAGE